MGWKGKKRQRGSNNADSKVKDKVNQPYHQDADLSPSVSFVHYYKDVQTVIPKNEYDEFIKCGKSDLPSSFRFCGAEATNDALRSIMKEELFPSIEGIAMEEKGVTHVIHQPKELTWCPGQKAYQSDTPRYLIRKNATLKYFHKFLVDNTECGNITRQETVSMIPPILLDPQPGDKILDMCASPGSKTSQLVEYVAAKEADCFDHDSLVIANDADAKRCQMLTHRVKKLNSCAFMVTNNDAAIFPTLYTTPNPNANSHSGSSAADEMIDQVFLFDKILADVPCSGDGTVRKNKTVWKKYTPQHANGLHNLQIRILKRGVDMLKPGGTICYSTCSLNPIEDEAVVASVLNMYEGRLELCDVSNRLQGLKYCEGITQWKVCHGASADQTSTVYNTFDEVPQGTKGVDSSMFAPQNVAELGLKKCMRILPHHQNTGGFFICLLKMKGKHEVYKDEAVGVSGSDGFEVVAKTNINTGSNRLARLANKEGVVLYSKEGGETETWLNDIKLKYDLKDTFPWDCVFARIGHNDEAVLQLIKDKKSKEANKILDSINTDNTEFAPTPPKQVFVANRAVKQILTNNYKKLSVVFAGVKCFENTKFGSNNKSRSDDSLRNYRICQDSLRITGRYVGPKRSTNIPYVDLVNLLGVKDSVNLKNLSIEFNNDIEHMVNGAFCCVFDPSEAVHKDESVYERDTIRFPFEKNFSSNKLETSIYLCFWKDTNYVKSMIASKEKDTLLMCLVGLESFNKCLLYRKEKEEAENNNKKAKVL